MKRSITFYNSFEEQEEDNRKQLAKLTSSELMLALRKLINVNFRLDNIDRSSLPNKHTIKIIEFKKL